MMAMQTRTRRAVGAAIFFVLSLGPALVEAQDLRGRVEADGEGIGGIPVELHRVTRDTAGVVERTESGADGSFRLPVPPADTAGFTVYFATANHLGVRYFGAPLHPGEPRDGYVIAVYDTVPAGTADVPVAVQRRDVILLPDGRGGWEVNELIQIANRGGVTLMPGEGMAVWELPIPAHATDFEVGDTEVSVDDVVRLGDRALLVHPLVPGVREMFVRYRIGAEAPPELSFRVGSPTDSMNVLVGQPSPRITVEGLSRGEAFEAQGQTFASYQGGALGADDVVTMSWRPVGPPIDPTMAALAIVALFLAAGTFAAMRRRDRLSGIDAPDPPGSTASPEAEPAREAVG
jgi:hypothetical protein